MTSEEKVEGPIFQSSLRAAFGRVPLWLLTTLGVMALALPVGMLTHSTFAGAIGSSYEPGSLIQSLDTNFVIDSAGKRGELKSSVAIISAGSALLAVLMGIFTAGGWLQVFFQRTAGHSVRRFFHGGVRHFWRFTRVFLLVMLCAAVIQRVVYYEPWHNLVETSYLQLPEVEAQGASVGPKYSAERMEELPDELTARQVVWVQDALHAILMALLLTWAVFTRTRLAMHDASSSVWAGLCTLFTMLRHPIKTLRPMILLLLIEAFIVFIASFVHAWMEDGLGADSEMKSVAMIFALSSVVLMLSEIIHAARYQAAISVSHLVIGPISRPDPWKHSVGAPGGPQYPIIEGSDEYGVAL
ncbi:MAG: hypothetical protein ACI8TQ_000595 [Planctomycetota bacterium]|jgi:hypothetical protein